MGIHFNRSRIALAAVAALGSAALGTAAPDARAGDDGKGRYASGDFHNHSTCSDGSISMQKLVKKSTDKVDTPWGLDWFVQAGHGGSGSRNCTLVEDESLATPAYPFVAGQGPQTTWTNSIGAAAIKGNNGGVGGNGNMWRWQSIQEFQYPVIEYLSALKGVPLFLGLESVVAGHEHSSMSVITGQIPRSLDDAKLPATAGYAALGNASALAQWSYCFDRGDSDTSRGNVTGTTTGNNWNCAVTGSANAADPSWNATGQKLLPATGSGAGERGHAKTVEALKWMKEFHPTTSYYVPAHLERAGPFNPNGNNGFNIEHLRNFNNAAPDVAFGFETQPGHGASDARGEYNVHRNNIGGVNVDSVGGTTYGGTGVYGAQVGGVWDALLGEGRNWFFFASSDWHNRGSFGADDRRSTQDFLPGEYQRNYTLVSARGGERERDRSRDDAKLTPKAIVDGLRTGNTFATSGQLIDRLAFVACASQTSNRGPILQGAEALAVRLLAIGAARQNAAVDQRHCASMGEKLVVPAGSDVVVAIVVRDPEGSNYSPYTFDNPSLAQVGIRQPLNKPVLDHIDVIRGMVGGFKTPGSADYAGTWPASWITNPDLATVPAAAKNTTAGILRTFNDATWSNVPGKQGYIAMSFRIPAVAASQYLRLRGSNLPPSVPFETDANGNPLADIWTNQTAINPSAPGGTDGTPAGANLRIPCTVVGTNLPSNAVTYTGAAIDGCPNHLPVINGVKYSAFDVAAWSDLWFYSNPIFIEVKGATVVAGIR